MFEIGDYVVYADDGVCQVADVGRLSIRSSYARQGRYYTLKPLFYKGTIYVPVGKDAPLRALISGEEARELLTQLPDMPASPSYVSDKRLLADHYKKVMEPGTCLAFAQAAKGIYEKYHTPGIKSKQPNAMEMQVFKRATELLVQELSVALDEPMETVAQQIEAVCGLDKGQAMPRSSHV